MEIKINVDETMFKDVIENELKAFSKEELHEIVRECIVEALHNDHVIRNIFITPEKDYWGNYKYEKPSQIMIDAAKTFDLSPAYAEIKDKMIETLKKDYHGVLEKAMLGLILNGISNDYDFQCRMNAAIQEAIMRDKCNN